MTSETEAWLCGQIEAVRLLGKSVMNTVCMHNQEAGKLMEELEYACNRAATAVHKAAEAEREG